jgi:hypothetical protein
LQEELTIESHTQLAWPLYKNDIYGPSYGASVLAIETMMRYLFSGAVPLFTIQMIDKIGFQWSVSLLGFISLALLPIPWVIYRFGPRLRVRSRYVQLAQ